MSDAITNRSLSAGLKQTGPLAPAPKGPEAPPAPQQEGPPQSPVHALGEDASAAQGHLAAGPEDISLPPPPPPPPQEARPLRLGSRGPEVEALQALLTELGVEPGPGPADGRWGERTQAAVLAFQRAQGLTADGVVGPRTREALALARSQREGAQRSGPTPPPPEPAPPRPQPGPTPPRPQPEPTPPRPRPEPTPPRPRPEPTPPRPQPEPSPGPQGRPGPTPAPRGGGNRRAEPSPPTPQPPQPVIPVDQSLATSARILFQQGASGTMGGGPARDITRVPLPPQEGRVMDQAARAAAENAPLITERMAALNEGDRQNFLALMNPLPGGARLDATAVLALQRMLLENRLPGPANAEGRNLLSELVRVGTDAPLAAGVSRSELISQTLREVAVPASINQQGYGTCAMSSLQIAVASRDPAEYLRLAAGLASPARQVAMRNGQVLRLPEGAGPQPDPAVLANGTTLPAGRSLPTRLMAPALMHFGAQSLRPPQSYNPTIDRMVDARQAQTYGMYMSAVNAAGLAIQGRGGRPREVEAVTPNSSGADRLIGRIQSATQAGELVPVSMRWGALDAAGNNHAAHAVVVERIEGDRVHILNPWGQAERFTLAEFRARLLEGVVPTR